MGCLILISFMCQSQPKQAFYYELISNESKSTNFVFGFYPESYKYEESANIDPFTSIKAAVINNAKSSLTWNDYKICILLNSGKLIRSYTTVATSGDYNCKYTVPASTTHYQYFCFHSKFKSLDIDKVWLVMGDDQIFNLIYDANK